MTILVTGAAGFIGSNFVLDWLKTSSETVINLDKLTYAGNLENLTDIENEPNYTFIKGDIVDGDFIKNLFENNKEAYNEAVKKLNSCASFLEADDYIHNVLMPKYKWDENTVHVIKFIDIIERRYLPH